MPDMLEADTITFEDVNNFDITETFINNQFRHQFSQLLERLDRYITINREARGSKVYEFNRLVDYCNKLCRMLQF